MTPEQERPRLRVVLFGTFDEGAHPRVRVLREAMEAAGHTVIACNEPLGVSTAERLRAVRRPWTTLPLVARLVRRWIALVRRSRRIGCHGADVVLVGYLGVLDVHLARVCFAAPVVLDHMAPVAGTAGDRSLPFRRTLGVVDRLALRAADVVVVDTSENVPQHTRTPVLVVPVGAPSRWFDRDPEVDDDAERLTVVFFGLYTPLQGTPVIAGAIRRLADRHDIGWTLIGTGQERETAERLVGDAPTVRWIDWAEPDDLARQVAQHHVCLGIFGTTDKAQKVVPNKVFQGAAAGCAVLTSDTPPQRAALGDDGVLVPPGDAVALADAVAALADDRHRLATLRRAAAARADREFSPSALAPGLDEALRLALRSRSVADHRGH